MDDMKRAMYIAARNDVQKSEPRLGCFICCNLNNELKAQGLNLNDYALADQILEEFFPEFFDLFDYAFWTDGFRMVRNNYDKHTAWFAYADKKRRLAILDFIIDNR